MLRRIIALTAGVLCFVACLISYQLTAKHVTGAVGPGWFEAGCEDSQQGSGANCAAVLASPYSFFPKKVPGELKRIPRIPVALLGWAYYSTMLTWMIGVGIPRAHRRTYHLFPLILALFGLAASAYYTYIMFTKLQEWCPWCLATHVLNLLMFGGLVVLWRMRVPYGESAAANDSADASSEPLESPIPSAAGPPQPTRLAIVTMLMILVTLFCEVTWVSMKSWQAKSNAYATSFNQCQTEYGRLTASGDLFLTNWQKSPRKQGALQTNAPTRGRPPASGDALQVLVVSDFGCPSCKAVSLFMETQAQRLFDHRLAISFRHFPLYKDCNPETTTTRHPFACFGAKLAESAKLLGGDDAFWKMHDYLFEHQNLLKAGLLTISQAASDVGLEEDALAQMMKSPAVSDRIAADARLGREIGVQGTPTIFVDGRLLDRHAKTDIGFWNKLSDWYWERLKQPRPPSTLLRKTPTTPEHPIPDSRDPTGAR